MMLKIFFDISTGFRFSKISVECSIHLCSSPWFVPSSKQPSVIYCILTDFQCFQSPPRGEPVLISALLYSSSYCFTRRLNNPTSGKQDVEEHFICPIKAATFFAKETFKAIGRQLRWQWFEPDNTCILRLMGLHKEIIY